LVLLAAVDSFVLVVIVLFVVGVFIVFPSSSIHFWINLGITLQMMWSWTLSIVSPARFSTPYAMIWSFASGNTSSSRGRGRFPHCTYGFGRRGKPSNFLNTWCQLAIVL
jgi:hypothetical protein